MLMRFHDGNPGYILPFGSNWSDGYGVEAPPCVWKGPASVILPTLVIPRKSNVTAGRRGTESFGIAGSWWSFLSAVEKLMFGTIVAL